MNPVLLLEDIVSQYALENENFLSANYITQLRNSVSVFSKYLDRKATIEDLDPRKINAWLMELKSKELAPKTVKLRRNSILTLWKWCYESMIVDVPPRAKQVRLKPGVPKTWTTQEICELVRIMLKDEKEMANGIVKGVYFASLTLALYSSGLRLADVLKARRADVKDDGSYQLIANKTGRLIVRNLDPRAVGLALSSGKPRRELIWELPYHRSWIFKRFKEFTKKVGLEGSTRFIRRSSATHTCQQQGIEEARKLLDHRSISTLVNHYLSDLDSFKHDGPDRLEM